MKVKGYEIKFDKSNPNTILLSKDGKLINMIACPPIKNGCDIINIFQDEIVKGYTYNFDGLILITKPLDRTLYYKGEQVDSIMRIKLV